MSEKGVDTKGMPYPPPGYYPPHGAYPPPPPHGYPPPPPGYAHHGPHHGPYAAPPPQTVYVQQSPPHDAAAGCCAGLMAALCCCCAMEAATDPPPPPPLLPLRLHQAAFLLSTASMLINRTKLDAGDLLTLTMLALAHTVACVYTLLEPRHYWQQRHWFLPAVRLMFYLSYRRAGIGTIDVLDRPATAGLTGVMIDFFRISLGTRALGLAMAGLVFGEPPAATLLVQSVYVALLMAGNSEGYCSTQLLASPLSRARMHRLAAALETATLPAAVVLQPLPSGSSALSAGLPILQGTKDACPAVVSFVNIILAVVMPTLAALHSWHPPPPSPEHIAQQPCSLHGRVAAAFAAADRALHRLFLGGAPWRPPLVVWYCCTAAWWACRFSPVQMQG
ncbi:mRNA cap guanine-N7 methyltransferase [Chlorella sorokiniana]|uniref:mRNA cap guanine-N7 methyltransferase n=1 Tax=Chlorella sorokiniana TaxID=3076 RepID=A0A2P6TED8_CHLSO|nr:mRNA cap guanine-N7 methyltransferase [Chlorella sorokiniana]|eukprot:PRW21013.1 mRNA cap guanine-N7 methyltransferase [Chlorella sorokiniana]